MKQFFIIAGAAMLIASCSTNKAAQQAAPSASAAPSAENLQPQVEGPVVLKRIDEPAIGSPAFIPKATIYRMTGDYLNNVAVQVDAAGNLISFPAPTDIPANPTPIRLEGGWLLSPMGIGSGSVFTRWTYAEYRALESAPTPEEIRKAIIPGAKVSESMLTNVPITEALTDTAAVNRFIQEHTLVKNVQ